MSDQSNERAFQDEIISHLTANGWMLGNLVIMTGSGHCILRM
jgi:hypothetical protein